MPIQVPNPPVETLDAVRSAVRSFAERAMFRTPALRAAQPEQLTINEPHPDCEPSCLAPLVSNRRDLLR
jgi:hypothetical protein